MQGSGQHTPFSLTLLTLGATAYQKVRYVESVPGRSMTQSSVVATDVTPGHDPHRLKRSSLRDNRTAIGMIPTRRVVPLRLAVTVGDDARSIDFEWHLLCSIPCRVWCFSHQMTIEIRRAVVPPYRSAFAQRHLGSMNRTPRRLQCDGVVPSGPNGPSRGHEFADQGFALVLGECRVGRPPESPANYEVPAVGGAGLVSRWRR